MILEIINNTAAGATSSGVYDSVDADVNAKDLMSKSMNGIFGFTAISSNLVITVVSNIVF